MKHRIKKSLKVGEGSGSEKGRGLVQNRGGVWFRIGEGSGSEKRRGLVQVTTKAWGR